MTNKEIKERIDWLEIHLFRLAMIDHWTAETYKADEKYTKELNELKKLIKE